MINAMNKWISARQTSLHVDYKKLNDRVDKLVTGATSQIGFGILYLWWAFVTLDLWHRNYNSGFVNLATELGIGIYPIVFFLAVMSVYCFMRDRLPIHYAIGVAPWALYSIYIFTSTVDGDVRPTGMLSAGTALCIAYLGIVGVFQAGKIKALAKDLLAIKREVRELEASIDERNDQPG